MDREIKRECRIHGFRIFKLRQHKAKTWYTCLECIRETNRRASKKYRKNHKEYCKDYQKRYIHIKKSLSLFLTMILIAKEIRS